ncbi:MAG: hypothetical protein Q8Q50_02770 [Methylobacter sp.]|nr:hypothetical protein [Methylobacter sp.]
MHKPQTKQQQLAKIHIAINKPRYLGIPVEVRFMPAKEMWQKNYIPFAGYLAMRYDSQASAWTKIMSRWVRMKSVVWPDEFRAFYELFTKKHPEFSSKRAWNDNCTYGRNGAYYQGGCLGVNQAFRGWEPIFPGNAFSPKPENRNKEFIRLTTAMMRQIGKQL